MRRILVSALLTSAVSLPAYADPLPINPDAYVASPNVTAAGRASGVTATATAPAAGEPQPRMRYADASQPSLGGGFIEFLFGGAARQPAVQRPYQPTPPEYQLDPSQQPTATSGDQGQRYSLAYPGAEAHPAVDPKFDRQTVTYSGSEAPGTIVIDTSNKFLYLVEGDGKALRYGIGVGRPGFAWAGVKTITAMREWPDWRPPDEMLARRPDLPRYMAGGPENPLGARAMYLGSTLYRIHGSNEPWTIGTNVSSGCIRMRNEDVEDLYNRVPIGTKVVVI
jgi:lipoprotein-anchoring transpeptidase ErfK/SrfK